ncbi:MAG: alpha-amylase family glycosyl hydrolase [Rikenellaceae bacterium]
MIHPMWSYSATLYEMNIRQLTPSGTIKAATKRLNFLRQMGIDTLWLMPIYPIGEVERKGSLGSYYSIADYCAVNSEFGTIEDFDEFLAQAHNLGFKVILDWVANHTARDAKWITERNTDWYERDENGEALVPWDWSDTAKLNYANHDVWQGQIDAMKFWLQRGVDGFRCDMAMLVPIEFWQEVSTALHAINPDVFMLAEAEELNLFDRAFDTCYAWELHHLMCDVAQGHRRADALRDYMYNNQSTYPRWSMKMTFTSNHDENSWQGTEQSRFGDALEIMNVFSFIIPGSMPLIYTGQEVGYNHSFQFFDRDPIPTEIYKANATTEFYKKLIEMKHSHTSLRAGEQGGVWHTINNNAEDCLLIIVRETAADRIISIMNMSPYTIYACYNTGIYAGDYRDALTGEEFHLLVQMNEIMEGWQYRVLSMKR